MAGKFVLQRRGNEDERKMEMKGSKMKMKMKWRKLKAWIEEMKENVKGKDSQRKIVSRFDCESLVANFGKHLLLPNGAAAQWEHCPPASRSKLRSKRLRSGSNLSICRSLREEADEANSLKNSARVQSSPFRGQPSSAASFRLWSLLRKRRRSVSLRTGEHCKKCAKTQCKVQDPKTELLKYFEPSQLEEKTAKRKKICKNSLFTLAAEILMVLKRGVRKRSLREVRRRNGERERNREEFERGFFFRFWRLKERIWSKKTWTQQIGRPGTVEFAPIWRGTSWETQSVPLEAVNKAWEFPTRRRWIHKLCRCLLQETVMFANRDIQGHIRSVSTLVAVVLWQSRPLRTV